MAALNTVDTFAKMICWYDGASSESVRSQLWMVDGWMSLRFWLPRTGIACSRNRSSTATYVPSSKVCAASHFRVQVSDRICLASGSMF